MAHQPALARPKRPENSEFISLSKQPSRPYIKCVPSHKTFAWIARFEASTEEIKGREKMSLEVSSFNQVTVFSCKLQSNEFIHFNQRSLEGGVSFNF